MTVNATVQLRACLKRIILNKRKNIRVVICELFFHLVVGLCIAISFFLATTEDRGAASYSRMKFIIPPPGFEDFNPSTTEVLAVFEDLLKRPILVPDLQQYFYLQELIKENKPQQVNRNGTAASSESGKTSRRLLNEGVLHFAPDSKETQSLIDFIAHRFNHFGAWDAQEYHIHRNEEDAVEYILNHLEDDVFGLIVLREITAEKVNYLLRLNHSTIPNPNQIRFRTGLGLNIEYSECIISGFLSLQQAVDDWSFEYTETVVGSSAESIDADVPKECAARAGPPRAVLMPYPTNAYELNYFYMSVGFLVGFSMAIATTYPLSRFTKSVVEEKELRLVETMKIMGLQGWVHHLSWFITEVFIFLWIAVSFTILCSTSFFPHSDPILLFMFFFLFCLAEIMLGFIISVCFENAKNAAVVAPFAVFAFLGTNDNERVVAKAITSLLCSTAFAFGADIIVEYENGGVGIQWDNIIEGKFNFITVMGMLLLDCLVYTLLAWYLAQVLPRANGVPQPPLFFLNYRYWCPYYSLKENEGTSSPASHGSQQPSPSKRKIHNLTRVSSEGEQKRVFRSVSKSSSFDLMRNISKSSSFSTSKKMINNVGRGISRSIRRFTVYDPNLDLIERGQHIEAIPYEQQEQAVVHIKNLKKCYGNGHVAVDSVSLSLLEDQITCLLGHNGAGKTTLISMLTGLIDATEGTASIFGLSLMKDMPAIRQMMGICPQQNVLYPRLTVFEHLEFFGSLKGMVGNELSTAVETAITQVGLEAKRNVSSCYLSGGMKRKLSLAISLVGNPRFLLLDEPTSSMDPHGRQATWELLRRLKKGKVIILTTHCMEEAESLADRIVVMSEGNINCSGSSLYLKAKFGAGYVLSISKLNTSASTAQLVAAVTEVIPSAQLVSSTENEITFNLPADTMPSFSELLQSLTEKKNVLHIESYEISQVSLDNVFTSIEGGNDVNEESGGALRTERGMVLYQNTTCTAEDMNESTVNKQEVIIDDSAIVQNDIVASQKVTHGKDDLPRGVSAHMPSSFLMLFSRIYLQLLELLRKRMIILLRDRKGLIFQFVVPLIMYAFIFLVLTLRENPHRETITFDGNLMEERGGFTPRTYFAGKDESSAFAPPQMETDGMKRVHSEALTSAELSEELLDSRYYTVDRYGAFIYDDLITVQLQVDWKWVHENWAVLSYLLSDFDALRLGVYFDISLEQLHDAMNDLPLSTQVTLYGKGITPDVIFHELSNENVTALNSSVTISLLGAVNAFYQSAARIAAAAANITTGQTFDGIEPFPLLKFLADENLSDREVKMLADNLDMGSFSEMLVDLFDALGSNGSLSQIEGSYELKMASPYSVMHNSTSPHGMTAFHGHLISTAFKSCSRSRSAQYLIKGQPLPFTKLERVEEDELLTDLVALFLLIPLCYVPAYFVSFLVKERLSKSKHLQIVSGVSPYLYWIATYMWDSFVLSILMVLTFTILKAYGSHSRHFVGTSSASLCFTVLLVVYGISVLPLCYLYSMFFSNHSTAQIAVVAINFLTGFVLVLLQYLLVSMQNTEEFGHKVEHIFRFFPCYNVGEGLLNLSATQFANEAYATNRSLWSWDVGGRSITFMLLEAIGFFTLVLITESRYLRLLLIRFQQQISKRTPRVYHASALDADVQLERELVAHIASTEINKKRSNVSSSTTVLQQSMHGSCVHDDVVDRQRGEEGRSNWCGVTYPLLFKEVSKIHQIVSMHGVACRHTVRGISLACAQGELFGLLGLNGAGKSTTLGILTGDIYPSGGEIYIGGHPLSDPCAMQMIGYCPQTDPLFALMNAYETLWFFGRIRGIPVTILKERVAALIDDVGLSAYASKICGTYSGGNKRKLSLAVALIGDPRVLFLDEPSAGMDPLARRQLWTTIKKIAFNRTVVLVSHRMEEVEALCTRIGVLMSGQFHCLGTAQHLKNKFGSTYSIEIRCHPNRVNDCIVLCQQVSSAVSVMDVQIGYVRCTVERNQIDLSIIFQAMEQQKEMLEIYDYSITQSSIEQMFIRLAAEHEKDMENINYDDFSDSNQCVDRKRRLHPGAVLPCDTSMVDAEQVSEEEEAAMDVEHEKDMENINYDDFSDSNQCVDRKRRLHPGAVLPCDTSMVDAEQVSEEEEAALDEESDDRCSKEGIASYKCSDAAGDTAATTSTHFKYSVVHDVAANRDVICDEDNELKSIISYDDEAVCDEWLNGIPRTVDSEQQPCDQWSM